jgi:uncharacterized protein (DUF362 family)
VARRHGAVVGDTLSRGLPPVRRVVLARTDAGEGWGTAPYDPAAAFPERPGAPTGDNRLYAAVRDLLAGLGLDRTGSGSAGWNPLRDLVPAGGRVVVKPNLVRHRHGRGGPLAAVVTDPRLLRAVVDYAVDAVAPGGEVIVADSPLQSCDLPALRLSLGLDDLLAAAARNGVTVRLLDYRREAVVKRADGLIGLRSPLAGDPEGYAAVDLGAGSALRALSGDPERFRVTQYDADITVRHHDGGRHQFLIPRSLLAADLVISLPKIKTHRKAGMTGALKNLVGINGSKAWLPHHRRGSVREGGDEYLHPCLRKRWLTRLWERMDRTASLRLRRTLGRADRWLRESGRLLPFPDPYFEGSWWGNLTMAAMVCDLNRIFMYADAEGRLQERPVRRMLVLADAVLAGEGEGPLEPTPRELGVLLGGSSPVAVDWVAATLMGFDPWKIPCLVRPLEAHRLPLADFAPADLEVATAGESRTTDLAGLAAAVARPFTPASGWRGHIEAPGAGARAG